MKKILIGVVSMMIVGLVAVLPAQATGLLPGQPTTDLQVLNPAPGTHFSVLEQPEFQVEWTRYAGDVLWYDVQIRAVQPDGYGTYALLSYRYAPDQSTDWVRRNPALHVGTGQLEIDRAYTITVQAYGPSDQLVAEYPDDYKPTGLSLDYYTPLTPVSGPVTINIGW